MDIEFVGGPCDGQQIAVDEDKHSLLIPVRDRYEDGFFKVENHYYMRRIVNGIFVRLPNGRYPFDWNGRVFN
jgi:hypothetical protein